MINKKHCQWIAGLLLLINTYTANAGTMLADTTIEGRWDITITDNGKEIPSWLEVRHSGTHRLFGSFVGGGGSARPISKIEFANGKMHFTIPPQWEREDNDLVFDAVLANEKLTGTMVAANGKSYQWSAEKAPSLNRSQPPVWGNPVKLFNGTDMTGWHTTGGNQWLVEDGVLKSPKSGSNLVSDQQFDDFKLHIEFRYPKGSNSGVYLRGRYEIQINDAYGQQPTYDYLGAVYGFIKPSQMVAKAPGEWQYYDVTLVGRRVTVIANGVQIITDAEIPGITGGALNSREAAPGPLQIQGDHGPVELRNIIVTPALN
jgi:hypothetical protein